jgi:hypothetical protein
MHDSHIRGREVECGRRGCEMSIWGFSLRDLLVGDMHVFLHDLLTIA